MPVNGFLVNNAVQKYNYESLENYNTPDFSTSSTYQVGDYVMYQGKLYKCTTAITTSGAWNSSKWSLAILSDDVAGLKSVVAKNETVTVNDYLNIGKASKSAGIGGVGTFIPGNTDTRYLLKSCDGVLSITFTTAYWSTPILIFYDKDGKIVSYEDGNSGGIQTKTVSVPTGATKYSINCTYTYISSLASMEIINRVATLEFEMPTKQDAEYTVDVDVANSYTIGKATASGGFLPAQTDTAYVLKSCYGAKSISVYSGYWNTPKIVFYRADMSVLSTVDGTAGQNTTNTNVPDGAYMYAANCASSSTYLSSFAITETYNVEKMLNKVSEASMQNAAVYASLVTPDWIPAVVGFPYYIYFENLIKNGFLKDYDIKISNQYVIGTRKDMVCIIPTSSGETTIGIELYDKGKKVDEKTITRKIVSASASGTAKVLIIGDSKTEAKTPWEKLSSMLSDDSNVSFTFLGRVTTGGINREGYSGKNVVNFCDDANITGTTPNIFYDSNVTTTNGHHFSFSKAVSELGETPDIVFIDNGANQWTTSATTIKGCYDDMIASIHAVDSSIKVVIVLQEGSALANTPTYVGYGKTWLEYPSGANESYMLSQYKGKEAQNIFIMPLYVVTDLWNDFPMCMIPSFDGSNGETNLCMDNIHPGLNTNAWSSSTQYKYGAWVSKDGKGYGCKKPNTNQDPATDDGTYWAECKNLGDGYIKKGMEYYYMLKYLVSLES